MGSSVRVVLYAAAREAIGRSSLDWEVPAGGTTVGSLVDALARRYPRAAPILAHSRFLVNSEYARGRTRRVAPGDEFAVHPPYSGG